MLGGIYSSEKCPICKRDMVDNNRNGVGYGPWTHIDGWSEAVVDYIREFERGPERTEGVQDITQMDAAGMC